MVKFLVDHVSQFPSDAELTRYISTLSDKVRCHHILDLAGLGLVTLAIHGYVHTWACPYMGMLLYDFLNEEPTEKSIHVQAYTCTCSSNAMPDRKEWEKHEN